METQQTTQSAAPLEITKTYEKLLFPTPFYSFVDPEYQTIKDQLFELTKKRANEVFSETQLADLMNEDSDCISHIKQSVYTVCSQLPEFSEGKIPAIIGSNILFQNLKEHIPLHAYEHIPLVVSFVLNSGDFRPKIYYADPRGGVQTMNRNRVAQNIVETTFSLQAYEGEILITPGYLQRYVESNLSVDTFVILDVLVGFNT